MTRLPKLSRRTATPSKRAQALKATVSRRQSFVADLVLSTYISSTNAIAALEEVSIEQKEIRKEFPNTSVHRSSALLAHTKLARRFQRRPNNKRYNTDRAKNDHQTEYNQDESDRQNGKYIGDKRQRHNDSYFSNNRKKCFSCRGPSFTQSKYFQ